VKAYLDSSVVLRRLLGEQGALEILDDLELGITSQIMRLECIRTLDRLHLRGSISSEEFVELRHLSLKLMAKLEVVQMTEAIISLAESSFSVPLGSLDAIHLSSAILWQRNNRQPIIFLTHDRELALAATAQGLDVKGA